MESILNIKKGVALTLCFTLFASNLFFVSDVFGQERSYYGLDDFGIEGVSGSAPTTLDAPPLPAPIPPTWLSNQEDASVNGYNESLPAASLYDDFIGVDQAPEIINWLNQDSSSPLYDAWNAPSEATPFSSWDEVMEQYGNTQAGQSIAGEGVKDSSQGSGSGVSSAVGCSVGAALGSAVSGALSQAASQILGRLAINNAVDQAKKVITVPVLDSSLLREAQLQNNKLGNIEGKETGLSLFGIPILPSWDAIGYCVVNTMIAYISESTIRWINTGFKGNPAFIENFDQFFTDLANREVAIFIGEIASTDFLCEDIRVGVQKNILNRYNSQYNNTYSRTGANRGYGACTFDKRFGAGNYATGDGNVDGESEIGLASYTSGDHTASVRGGWEALALIARPENNTLGATLMANKKLDRNIESVKTAKKVEVVDVNNGNLSTKDERGNVVTPGGVIQGRLNKALDIPSDRLNIADEFNEVVTALINQLIKISLNETLGRVNSGLREVQNNVRGQLDNVGNRR